MYYLLVLDVCLLRLISQLVVAHGKKKEDDEKLRNPKIVTLFPKWNKHQTPVAVFKFFYIYVSMIYAGQ